MDNKFVQRVFLIYVLLLTVQDLVLQLYLGTIARSPYIFISPLIFVFISIISNKIYFFKGVKYYSIYYIYSILVTACVAFYYLAVINTNTVFGENLVLKCVKNSMYNLIIIITLYNYYFIFRYSSLEFVEKVLKYLILAQIGIGLVQIFIPHAFDFLKTPGLQMTTRLALLNSEPSYTFPQLIISLLCYFSIRFYLKKINALDLFIFLTGFAMLFYIQSRGGIVIMLLCFILILFFSRQTLKTRFILFSISILFMIPTAWVILTIIIPQLTVDLDQFSSISTRSITIITSLRSLIVYPFGQGYGTYLFTYSALLDRTTNDIVFWSPIRLITYELDLMLDSGRSLTVKSGLLNEILHAGWAIIIFYFFFFSNAYRQIKSFRKHKIVHSLFQYMLLFIIINYLLVSSIETSYITFLPFALLSRLAMETNESIQ